MLSCADNSARVCGLADDACLMTLTSANFFFVCSTVELKSICAYLRVGCCNSEHFFTCVGCHTCHKSINLALICQLEFLLFPNLWYRRWKAENDAR